MPPKQDRNLRRYIMLFTLNSNLIASQSLHRHHLQSLKHLRINSEVSTGILWNFIDKSAPTHFSLGLLDDIRKVQGALEAGELDSESSISAEKIKYLVFGSQRKDVFSLGGDLALFREYILSRNRDALSLYATRATDAVYHHSTNSRGVLTFSLVKGAAMGGGFEAALAGNVLVAERGARFGFPESLFGLFPGMGAFSFLRKRVGASLAKEIIVSGKTYTAQTLREIGVVDILAEKDEGEKAIRNYVNKLNSNQGISAFHRAVEMVERISLNELYSISSEWVEAALRLQSVHIARIERLIASQKRNFNIGLDEIESRDNQNTDSQGTYFRKSLAMF